MELKIRQHKIDRDQVEMFVSDGKWLLGICHIDGFDELEIGNRLFKGEEITLKVEEAE